MSESSFQSSAGDKPRPLHHLHPSALQKAVFQSSAGDKPRPLDVRDAMGACLLRFQSSAGDKPRPLFRRRLLRGESDGVSILGRGQAPAAREMITDRLAADVFQSSAGDKPRPLRHTPAHPEGTPVFQSSAGDKPRPLWVSVRSINLVANRFNPRPGTSPGRSRGLEVLHGCLQAVSILGRGQAPAALQHGLRPEAGGRCFNPRPGTSPGRSAVDPNVFEIGLVSILGRGQAPAAQVLTNLLFPLCFFAGFREPA